MQLGDDRGWTDRRGNLKRRVTYQTLGQCGVRFALTAGLGDERKVTARIRIGSNSQQGKQLLCSDFRDREPFSSKHKKYTMPLS
jgi:hypothetical protein